MHQKPMATSVTIFLPNGDPQGVRKIKLSLWDGRAVQCPRSLYKETRMSEEFAWPGLYFLLGPRPPEGHLRDIYVGEAEALRHRLDHQLSTRPDWVELICFTSQTALNKAKVKYLESQVVTLGKSISAAKLTNDVGPKQNWLNETDQAEMDGYLFNVLQLLPILGVDAFREKPAAIPVGGDLHVAQRNVTGHAIQDGARFIVLKGSEVSSTETDGCPKYLRDIRASLRSEHIIAKDGKGLLSFAKDHAFSSPSTAAGVILGCSVNGRDAWKNGAGQSLKLLELPPSLP